MGVGAHRYWRLYLVRNGGGGFSGSQLYLYDASAVNQAPAATLSASSTYMSFTVDHLNDGVGASFWGSITDNNEWVVADFGSGHAVEITSYAWTATGSPEQSPSYSVLEYSDDGSTWVNACWVFSQGWAVNQTKTWNLGSDVHSGYGSHAWWGIACGSSDAGNDFLLAEVEIRATIGGSNQVGGSGPVFGPYWYVSTPPIGAFDLDVGTCWAAGGYNYGSPVANNFASPVTCFEVAVISWSDQYSKTPRAFDVIFSDDGLVFPVAWSATTGSWGANETRTFDNPNDAPEPSGEADYDLPTITLTAPGWGVASVTSHYALGNISLTAPTWSAHAAAEGDYAPGSITLAAGEWAATVKTGVRELDIAAIGEPLTGAAIVELDVSAIGVPTDTAAQVVELDMSAVAQPDTDTHGGISEVEIAVLGYVGAAETYRCQVWKIVRKDGQVFAFTSLDRDITWGNVTYRTCNSLSSSASESASDLTSVGNVELAGILDDAAITPADIYAGLFDDAFVDVWVIPYNDQPDDQAPFRVAAGWTGKVTRQEGNFTAEVLGGGARLQQAALVSFYTPGCSWDFGVMDDNGIGCPVDAEARKVVGAVVTSSALRSIVHFDGVVDPGGSSIWNGGTIVWTSGQNEGVVCQVEIGRAQV